MDEIEFQESDINVTDLIVEYKDIEDAYLDIDYKLNAIGNEEEEGGSEQEESELSVTC